MSFFRAKTSMLPSPSPLPPTAPSEETGQGDQPRQPRKTRIIKPNEKEQPQSIVDPRKSAPKDVAVISSQNGSSSSVSQSIVQEVDKVQGSEQSYYVSEAEDREPDLPIVSAPETVQGSLESDHGLETIDSEIKETTQTSNSIVTTTTMTKVAELKHTGAQSADAVTHKRYGVLSSTQGGVQRKSSFYQETSLTPFSAQSQFSSSKVVETQRAMALSGNTYDSVQEELKRLKNLYIQQTDCTESILTNQHTEYRSRCEASFEALQTENETLRQQVASLENQLSLTRGGQATLSLPDSTESTITTITTSITTSITTITTNITTVTTRIDQWKRTVGRNTAQVTISSKELDQLSSDLSITSSRLSELQQRYAEQSEHINAVCNELKATLSVRDQNARTITALTTEVSQLKREDAIKAEQIATFSSRLTELQRRYETQSEELGSVRTGLQSQLTSLRLDNERLQRDLSSATAQNSTLQKRSGASNAQLVELDSLRKDVQAKRSLLDEKERAITNLLGELDQWKRTDAATRQGNEKLQQDLTALSSQLADLQKRYETQSKDLVSIRSELHSKVSQLEEKARIITSLTTDVDQWKRESTVKAEQLEAKSRDIDQLRRELSTTSSRAAELQKRYEAQSKDLDSVRDELRRIEILYSDGSNKVPGEPSKHVVSQQIAKALKEKNEQMDKLRRELATATSRNTELQKRCEALSTEVSTIRDELQVKTSQNEGTIASLTAQVDHWKATESQKAAQMATTLKQVEKLQEDLSTSTSQLTDLQTRYDAQSRDLIALRNDLQAKTSALESRDRTITSLSTQLKNGNAKSIEEITTSKKTVDTLQQTISTFTSQLAELKNRYDIQSRELAALRDELQAKTLAHDSKVRTIASLTADVDEWKNADAAKEAKITATLKQLEKLQGELSTATSQIAELQHRCDSQSNELKTRTSLLQGDRDRAIATLTTQVEQLRREDAVKAEQIALTRKQLESLQLQLTDASSRYSQLQQQYETQSQTHSSIRTQFEADLSAKDRTAVSLTSEVEKWKLSDARNVEELAAARKDLDQLRRDLATSTSQITEFQRQCEVHSRELMTLRSQLEAKPATPEEGQNRSVAILTSEIEWWKRSHAAKAEELETARKNLEQLQRDLSTASLRIPQIESNSHDPPAATSDSLQISEVTTSESQAFYDTITTQYEVRDHATLVKLASSVDEWLITDARRAEDMALELEKRKNENEELRQKLVTLKEIYVRAPELKQIFQSQTIEIQRRYEEQAIQLQMAVAQRQSQQSQLDNVQRFITTADTHADSALIQMLQKLNAEVQQSTTFMAEFVVEGIRRPQGTVRKLTRDQTAAMQRASQYIGQPLLDCLARRNADEVVLYLQFAFQAYLSCQLSHIVSSWTVENEPDRLVKEIYQRLQESEAQPIAGRWRSLTCTYILPTYMTQSGRIVSTITSGLSDIVIVAGCAASQSDAKTKISSKFESKISSIVSIAGQLSKMIGEVVSADFAVFSIPPGERFAEDTMEEDDEDKGNHAQPGEAEGQKVLCMTHMGMTKRMQVETGVKKTMTVTKGKVVLESFLGD